MTDKLDRRAMILAGLDSFIRQRPGLEFANYGDVSVYRAELRSITRDLHHARALLAAVGWRTSITADDLLAAARNAFSGRLSLEFRDDGKLRIDYCAGQYWPTEYRRAVCAVLASALWDHFRSNMPPASGTVKRTTGVGVFQSTDDYPAHDGLSAGDWLRRKARQELGASVARRWFN